MAFLVDTNVLVYRYDPRFPAKQEVARRLLRQGIETGEARVPHQTIVEFVPAVTRPLPPPGSPLLTPQEARIAAEGLLTRFPILYPTQGLVRQALRGAAAYSLSWFDAHLWAYAEFYGIEVLYSEDFEHERLYGTVRVLNPFAGVSG